MKIGLLNFVGDSTVDPAYLARACEALGFESLFLAEHPVVPTHYTRADGSRRVPDGKPLEPLCRIADLFVALSFAAAATSRLKLGTGICLVPERPPLLLAKEVATLDLYSGGRLIFGIGAGWLREESELMGVDFRRRWAITRECVRAMKELWTKEESSFEGRFVKFPPVYCHPKPIQKPHPPILIGARRAAGRLQAGARAKGHGGNRRRLGSNLSKSGSTGAGSIDFEKAVRRGRTRLQPDGYHAVLAGRAKGRATHNRTVSRGRCDAPGAFSSPV